MSAYEVVLLHRGLDDLADELIDAVRIATAQILLQADLVEFRDDLAGATPDSHVVVVYLGSRNGAEDDAVDSLLQSALDDQLPVLPLVRSEDPGTVEEKMPPSIKRINAADWVNERGVAIAGLLSMLGLAEPDRKVFLSYFRLESTPLAVQLHTALAEARFDVFLDRFAVAPGTDFQMRLDEDLGDKAFVVILESPSLRTSLWVQHEIAYAHSHRIGLLAVTLPGTPDTQLVTTIDEAFRVRLNTGDMTASNELTEDALKKILERVEIAHARELRRRREQLLGSLRDKLFIDGCTCEPVADWALVATAAGRKPTVFLITPRRPRPEDLYALHRVHIEANSATGINLAAALVHETEHLPDEHRALLTWIGEPRQFEAMLLRGCVLAEDPAA